MVGIHSNDSPFHRSIEVWDTTCVVTNMNAIDENGADGDNPGGGEENDHCQTPFSVLINPGNPSLSGVSKFSYFPVGGPEPPPSFKIGKDSHPIMGYVTSWGGMEVGNGMSFASNTVDGIVHQYGGKELKRECEIALSNIWNDGVRKVSEGMAISTPTVGSELRKASGYDLLVHTVPPFVDQDYRHDDETTSTTTGEEDNAEEIVDYNNFLLAECYLNSLRMAAAVSSSSSVLKIACPLLGAGCRGFPTERAIQVAASTTTRWMTGNSTSEISTLENSTPAHPKVTENRNTSTGNHNSTSTENAPTPPFTLWSRWFGGVKEGGRAIGEEDYAGNSHRSITLAFGIPDGEIREQLIKAIDREMEAHVS